MKFSFLIAVYNGMPWLKDCLESLREQTDRDFTVVIVNDGSSDGTRAYIESLIDLPIKLINQDNQGLVHSLNRGILECSSEWILRLDADDIALPRRVELTKSYIQSFPEADMIHGRAKHFIGDHVVGAFNSTCLGPDGVKSLLESGYLPSICHPTVAYKKIAVETAGLYNLKYVEDLDLWRRLGKDYNICFLNEYLIKYRMHEDSISAVATREQIIRTLYIQCCLIGSNLGIEIPSLVTMHTKLDEIADLNGLYSRIDLREAARNALTGKYRAAIKHAINLLLYGKAYLGRRFFASNDRNAKIGINPQVIEDAIRSSNPFF